MEHKYNSIKDYLENFYRDNPFTTLLDIKFAGVVDDFVHIILDINKKHTNVYGIAHGGVILTMADMTMGAVCLYEGAKVVTLSLTNNFIKAVKIDDSLVAKGKVVHKGRSTYVCECKIYNQNNELCAMSTGTFMKVGNVF